MERSCFSGGCVLRLKVETEGLSKPLRADPSFEFNVLVVDAKLLVVSPSGRNGVVRGKARDDVPDVMVGHVIKFLELSSLPLEVIVGGHCLKVIAGLDSESGESNCRASSLSKNVGGFNRAGYLGAMGTKTESETTGSCGLLLRKGR
jgi:hypothetical protein